MNRAAARSPLVADAGPPRCPICGSRQLAFRTDRHGRALEQCECGYRAYVVRRDGKREEPPAPIA
ncbi:MAG: hypothetical protein ACREME_08475 [Gemmatimonadales bacterium]